jgi:hypothetical protein
VDGSPCIDGGTEIAWLTTDLDGDRRPWGDSYDVGADEFGQWWGVYLSLVMNDHP